MCRREQAFTPSGQCVLRDGVVFDSRLAFSVPASSTDYVALAWGDPGLREAECGGSPPSRNLAFFGEHRYELFLVPSSPSDTTAPEMMLVRTQLVAEFPADARVARSARHPLRPSPPAAAAAAGLVRTAGHRAGVQQLRRGTRPRAAAYSGTEKRRAQGGAPAPAPAPKESPHDRQAPRQRPVRRMRLPQRVKNSPDKVQVVNRSLLEVDGDGDAQPLAVPRRAAAGSARQAQHRPPSVGADGSSVEAAPRTTIAGGHRRRVAARGSVPDLVPAEEHARQRAERVRRSNAAASARAQENAHRQGAEPGYAVLHGRARDSAGGRR